MKNWPTIGFLNEGPQGRVQGLKAPAQVLNIASEASYSACPWANRPADCLLLPKIVDIVQRPCCVGQNPLGAPASNYGLTKFLQVPRGDVAPR